MKVLKIVLPLFILIPGFSSATDYVCNLHKNSAEREVVRGKITRSGTSNLEKDLSFQNGPVFSFKATIKYGRFDHLSITDTNSGYGAQAHSGDNITLKTPEGDQIGLSCVIMVLPN